MPHGENDRARPSRQPRSGTGGSSLRAAAALAVAPAVLALVVLGGSVLATRRAYPETVVAGVALLLVLVLALVGLRKLLSSLARLRDSALTAANRVLPERIERLRDPRELGERTPEELVRDVADPVIVAAHDELGQVAYAVNTMYREALHSAAQQAVLRGEVNAMVFSLARRSQTLVDKMASALRDIEREETDPERLTRLFELDRLAARMRRNDENLLILTGVDVSPDRESYLRLTEVVKAAQSEVEHYGRVDHGTVDNDVAVTAHGAGDVVRLIAELIDNATRYSPPNTAVLVDGRRIGDYVLIEIEDRGLGMSPAQLETYNERLATPPPAELSDCRMMGLAVVGRLADRHQIRVTLRANSDTGTVVSVTLPTALLVLPDRRANRVLPRQRTPEVPAAAPPGWPLAGPTASALRAPAIGQVLPGGPGALPSRTKALPAGPSAAPSQAGQQYALPVAHATTSRQPAHASPEGQLPRHSVSGQVLALPAGSGPARPSTPFALPGPGEPGVEAPAVGDGDEPVIFREMRARWFGGPDRDRTTPLLSPDGVAAKAERPVTGARAQAGGSVQSGEAVGPVAGTGVPTGGKEPSQFMDDEYGWRSAGDEGWHAALAAAQPQAAGTTAAGLPRREPSAHLVPGGVPKHAAEPAAGRRDPDEVRGVLAAYHRGVQRGRDGGEAQSSSHPRSANEEMH